MELASKKTTTVGILLLVIVLIGLFLRAYHLAGESFWIDESFSVWMAKQSLPQIVQNTAVDVHPPLYYFILHYWVALFGTSEFAVRFLSVIFGVLAIPMIYLVGRLLFDEEVGLLGALILAVSAFNITYSQETRMYSLMVLLALLSMYFFLRFLRKSGLVLSAGYVLFTALLLYTHVYGLFVVLAQNIYVAALFFLSRARTFQLRKWAILEVILVILFLPWIRVFFSQISVREAEATAPFSATALITTFTAYAGSALLLLLFIGLGLLSLLRLRKTQVSPGWKEPLKALESYSWDVRTSDLTSVGLLLVWVLIPNVVPFLVSLFSSPIYFFYYTIAASVALYLLVASGIRNIKWSYAKLAVIAAVVVLSVAPLQAYYTSYAKGEARETFNVVNNDAKSGDLVIIYPNYYSLVFDSYNRRADLIVKPVVEPYIFWNRSGGVTNIAASVNELTSDAAGHNRVWFIYNNDDTGPGAQELRKAAVTSFGESFQVSYFHSYRGYDVYLFEKRAGSS
jgi:4-amino-4-deoxy-L-arabinose transferase-like glycosyltransferase